MKVALLAPIPYQFYNQECLDPDHSATWIVLLVDALLKRGIETHVVTRGSADINHWKSFVVSRPNGKVTVWAIETRKHGKMITDHLAERKRVQSCLQHLMPDVVHGNGTETLYSRCAVESGFPHVISLQTAVYWLAQVRKTDLFLWYTAFWEAWTVKQAERIIVKTNFSRHMMRAYLKGKPVHLIPNAVHPAFLIAGEKRHPRENYVVFAGSIRPDKGVFDLVHAMTLPKSGDSYLRICGYGSPKHEKQLRNFVQLHHLQERVKFSGQLDNESLADVVSRARALVLPTHCDNSPNVVWESIAAGTPVIATNVGGIPEMVEEGKTGQLMMPRDIKRLAKLLSCSIQELVTTSLDERLDIARQLSIRQSLEAIATAHIEVYKQAIANHV